MQLFYQEYGQGPPLIILHGLFGSSDNWLSIGKVLAGKFHVYLIDQRNHGMSPHSEEFTYQVMSNDLLEFMDAAHIASACIIGHSLGGKTAMLFSLQHPHRVKKLIVVDIAPRMYPVHHREILDAMLSLDVQTITSRKEADTRLSLSVPDTGIRQFLIKNLYWKTPGQLAWRINLGAIQRHIEEVGSALPDIGQYTGPSLFIRGSLSDYISEEDMSSIRNFFPAASLRTVHGAGHWPHAEKPDLFLAALELTT